MGKPIIINQDCPKKVKPYFLAPTGLYLNKALRKAKRGEVIVFQNGWRRDTRRIVRVCSIRIDTVVFTFMSKSLYGDSVTANELICRWRNEAILEGYGKNGVDCSVCILGEIEEM